MKQSDFLLGVCRKLVALLIITMLNVSVVWADDVAGVNALLDRIEQAYANRDAHALSACLSDDFVAVVDLPNRASGAIVFNKSSILRALGDRFAKGTSQQTHRFIQRDMMLRGPMAVMRVVTQDKWPYGQTQTFKGFRIAVNEQGTWRMLLALPLFFRPTVMVTEVFPGSRAARMGLQVGDIITFYAGQKFEAASEFASAIHQHANDPPGTAFLLKTTRQGKEITYNVGPGTLGIRLESRLLPDDGAEMIGAEKPHPVKEAARRIGEAIRRQDVEAGLSECSPNGFVFFLAGETGGEVQIIGARDARERLPQYWQRASQFIDYGSLQLEESRAIVKGNVGLVACRWRLETAGHQTMRIVEVQAYACENGRWRFIADLPLGGGFDIGLDPPLLSGTKAREKGNAPQGPRIASGLDTVLLSNFDSGDDLLVPPLFPNSRWQGGRGNQKAASMCEVERNNGAARTQSCLKWTYHTKGTWVNAGLLLSGSWNQSVDLSQYDSVSFYIKGRGERGCNFKIQTAPWKGKVLTGAAVPIKVTSEWQKVVIDLKTEPKFKGLNLTKTYTIEFVDWAPEYASNVVWIDEIMLHRSAAAKVERLSIPRKVLAFYYPWYGNPKVKDGSQRWSHWEGVDEAKKQISTSTHYPLLGAYDSHSPDLIAQHCIWAKHAGVDGLIVSWWGKGGFEDQAVERILKGCKDAGLQMTVYYEAVPSPKNAKSAAKDVLYVLNRYGSHPAWLKVDGKPVIFVYGRALGEIGLKGWREAIAEVNNNYPSGAVFIGDQISQKAARVFDGLHTYNPVGHLQGKNPEQVKTWAKATYSKWVETAASQGRISTLTIIPGYDDTKIRKPGLKVERFNGDLYRAQWEEAIAAAPHWVLITSWNEWHEGSDIEPSVEHGGKYLNITAEFAKRFKSNPSLKRRVDTNVRANLEATAYY